MYTLKLCESSPPTSCGSDIAVCAKNLNNNTDQSVGEYSSKNDRDLQLCNAKNTLKASVIQQWQ